MKQGGDKKRYWILIIASVINFVHGNPYIWTVFQPYVKKEFHLSDAASSQPFTIIIGIFALGNMLGGWLQQKIGAKWTILAGSALMCAGFGLAGIAPYDMPWLISMGYGALGGLGSGCAFSMLTAVPLQWFPEKRGLVSGITVGVVGVSGIIMNPFCDFLLAGQGYRFAMLTITAIYGVLCLGGFFVEDRPDDMRSEGEDPVSVGTGMESCVKQYRTGEMLRTRTYYTISLTMALAVPAYVLVNPLMKSLGMERGLTGAEALLGVTLASVANIIGRFAMPWLSDRVGRKAVIRGMYLAAAVAVIGLVAARGGIFILLISVVCLVYGGVVSVFPVVVSDHFGLKYQGINYGAVMIGYGIASILCPYLLDGLGLEASFVAAGVACVIGLVGTRFF